MEHEKQISAWEIWLYGTTVAMPAGPQQPWHSSVCCLGYVAPLWTSVFVSVHSVSTTAELDSAHSMTVLIFNQDITFGIGTNIWAGGDGTLWHRTAPHLTNGGNSLSSSYLPGSASVLSQITRSRGAGWKWEQQAESLSCLLGSGRETPAWPLCLIPELCHLRLSS